MVFAAALVSYALLATAAVAAPSGRLANRLARRRAGAHQSSPMRSIEGPSTDVGVSNVEYSENWAGAVYDSYPSGTFSSVTATFTVPTPSGSSGSASAWVGIDGDTCDTAILQTGVDFTVDDGEVSYDAWYEWYPAYAYDFSGISLAAGDEIKLTVTASTTKKGTAVIENITTGQTVSKSLTSTSALCLENAEWIVEDYEEGNSLVPFANFGTVTFSGAEATTTSGTIGPSGATLIDIEQNNEVLTSSSTTSTSVTVSYT